MGKKIDNAIGILGLANMAFDLVEKLSKKVEEKAEKRKINKKRKW